MGVIDYGGILVHGNFAEVLPEKPKDFNYEEDAKWLEPYPKDFEYREKIGSVICTCKIVEVHYAPYYGFDFYHTGGCNLLRQIKARPSLLNLVSYEHLPAIVFYENQTVPAKTTQGIYIDYKSRKVANIPVKVRLPQASLF